MSLDLNAMVKQIQDQSASRHSRSKTNMSQLFNMLMASDPPTPTGGEAAPSTKPNMQAAATRLVGSGPPKNLPAPKGNLSQWINSALKILHLGPEYAAGIANMIQHESGGNPRAINNWDSNAKAGTPSKGLMQTIDPTFNAWKLPGYGDIYDPVSNIIAGTRYALNRYGNSMVKSGGRRDSKGNYIGY